MSRLLILLSTLTALTSAALYDSYDEALDWYRPSVIVKESDIAEGEEALKNYVQSRYEKTRGVPRRYRRQAEQSSKPDEEEQVSKSDEGDERPSSDEKETDPTKGSARRGWGGRGWGGRGWGGRGWGGRGWGGRGWGNGGWGRPVFVPVPVVAFG